MSSKQMEGAFGIFIIGTLIACIASGRWLLNGEISIITALNSFNVLNYAAGSGISVPTGLLGWWNALVTALSWNYPYLDSAWCIFVKIPLWIVSFSVVVGLIQLAMPILASLVSFVRSFIP